MVFQRRSAHESRSDEQLIELVREGDSEAYAVLYERHSAGALAFAQYCSRSSSQTAQDLVSGAFTNILAKLRAGQGPTNGFKPYLLRTIRNSAIRTSKANARASLTSRPEILDSSVSDPDTVIADHDSRTVWASFKSLTPRHQEVLWHSVVEGLKPREVAPILGVSPNHVSVLVGRAKDSLRTVYLTQHLAAATKDDCKVHRKELLADLRTRDARKSRLLHLEVCPSCANSYQELSQLGMSLRAVAPIALLGIGAAELATGGIISALAGSGGFAGASWASLSAVTGGKTLAGTVAAASVAAVSVVAIAAPPAYRAEAATHDPVQISPAPTPDHEYPRPTTHPSPKPVAEKPEATASPEPAVVTPAPTPSAEPSATPTPTGKPTPTPRAKTISSTSSDGDTATLTTSSPNGTQPMTYLVSLRSNAKIRAVSREGWTCAQITHWTLNCFNAVPILAGGVSTLSARMLENELDEVWFSWRIATVDALDIIRQQMK